jgi:hypothetical protein
MGLHFNVRSPLATHWREASCEEIDCESYRTGWRLRYDTLPPDMQYAATHSGRRYTEITVDFDPDTQQFYNPPATFLVFEAGQPCFRSRQHRVPTGRPEVYVARNDMTGERVLHTSPQNWVDHCGEHVESIVDIMKRG